jgi:transposase
MSPAPVRPARSPTSRSNGCWSPPWRPRRLTPPTGRPAAWPAGWACRSRPSAASGGPLGSSRTWSTPFKLSTDPQFIDKVRDIVGLYLNPSQAAMVLCVDEKTSVQALDRTAPILPLLPGTPQRATHDYTRHGVTNLYAALDVASGKVIAQLTARHRAIELKRFLALVDAQVPAGLDLHVICDNSSTHKTPAIQRWLLAHPRVHLHFTPTYSSWLNLVERWFSELTSKWLRRGTHRSVAELTASIQSWIDTWNQDPRPFVWTKTADEILDTMATYCQRINDSGH